jgi:hypothetical protein
MYIYRYMLTRLYFGPHLIEILATSLPPLNHQGRWGRMGFLKYHPQNENPYVGVVGPEEEEEPVGHDLVLRVAVVACSSACRLDML